MPQFSLPSTDMLYGVYQHRASCRENLRTYASQCGVTLKILFLIPQSPGARKIVRLIECSYETKAAYLWQPNDYLIISSLLEGDDVAQLIDGTADDLDALEFLHKVAIAPPPDLLFFSLGSACWDSDFSVFQTIRNQFYDTPIYLIGDLFLEDDYLDLVLPYCEGVVYNPYLLDLKRMKGQAVRGNCELPGLRRWNTNSSEVSGELRLDSSGIPRHELFSSKGYVFPFARYLRFATVTTYWGCPFSCSYCNMSRISPVVRPWQNVVTELEYIKSLEIQEIYFSDKAFGYPPENAHFLLDEMIRRFSFSWSCYFHPQMYRSELLDKMYQAGCHTIIIGLESFDQAGLEHYGRVVSPARVESLLEHANRLGIDVCADFIVGLEHETEEDVQRTITYALDLPIDFVSINVAAPLPGSGIRKKAVESGEMVFGVEGFDTLGRTGALDSGNLKREQIITLRNRAVRRFYFRPGYLLRRLKRTVSWEHLLLQCRQMKALFTKS